MRVGSVLLALGVLGVLGVVEGRVNSTSAFATFKIKNCEECIEDEDSIWCSEGTGYIQNASWGKVYTDYAQNGEPIPGHFCWLGTFGTLLESGPQNYTKGILNSPEWVYVDLECEGENLYYNQCILPSTTAIILMVIGSIVFSVFVTVICICFGFCQCGTDDDLGCCKKIKRDAPGGRYICACCEDLDDPTADLAHTVVTDNTLMEKSALDIEMEEEEQRKAASKFGSKRKKKKSKRTLMDGDGGDSPKVEKENPLAAKKDGAVI